MADTTKTLKQGGSLLLPLTYSHYVNQTRHYSHPLLRMFCVYNLLSQPIGYLIVKENGKW